MFRRGKPPIGVEFFSLRELQQLPSIELGHAAEIVFGPGEKHFEIGLQEYLYRTWSSSFSELPYAAPEITAEK